MEIFQLELWMRNETSMTGGGDEKLSVDIITLVLKINDFESFLLKFKWKKKRFPVKNGRWVAKKLKQIIIVESFLNFHSGLKSFCG